MRLKEYTLEEEASVEGSKKPREDDVEAEGSTVGAVGHDEVQNS
jgi:hypothetical protein